MLHTDFNIRAEISISVFTKFVSVSRVIKGIPVHNLTYSRLNINQTGPRGYNSD
jgi:hypothetical protein